jgi:hypothetical protein
MKKLSFIDFLGFAGIAVAILAVYITFTFVKAYNPTTPELLIQYNHIAKDYATQPRILIMILV